MPGGGRRMSDLYRVCLALIMVVAALAFCGFFMAAFGPHAKPHIEVLGVLGMGFSAVVFTLGLVGVALISVLEELKLLNERKHKRLEAEERAAYQAWLADGEKRRRERERRRREHVDPEAMQITRKDLAAQRKTDWRHRREIWRGRVVRFWNGVRQRIARVLGEENTILVGLVFGIVKTLACIVALVAVAAVAIGAVAFVTWGLLH